MEKQTIGERIRQIRRQIGLSQAEFGKRIGVSDPAISMAERGITNASDQTILSICREFGVNETWLRTGEGEMRVKSTGDAIQEIVRSHGLTPEDYALISWFADQPDTVRQTVIQAIVGATERVQRVREAGEKAESVGEEVPEETEME